MTLTEFHVINTEKIAMNNHIAEHDELILEVKNLKKFYKAKTNSHFFGKKENLEAVGGIDLSVYKGEIIGIIGESGCGKSTLGKLLVNLEPPTFSVEPQCRQCYRNIQRNSVRQFRWYFRIPLIHFYRQKQSRKL